ncbi:MAG: hypothetical protein C5B53_12750 [Candidatus Melainabacteria bacterium]|nr:MAG: hypothetical protein C5B53_12750 [Candidatus Melainabacteria bacterium]
MDAKKLKPRNIKENKLWQDSVGAFRQMWTNYINLLSVSFHNMSREEQCKLITRLSQIITIGVTALVLSLFYQFLPLFVRVLVLPPIVIVAWLIGTRIVSPVIIRRVGRHLNQ